MKIKNYSNICLRNFSDKTLKFNNISKIRNKDRFKGYGQRITKK